MRDSCLTNRTAMTRSIPLEVWENILSNLSKHNLAPCLMVCRTLHGIAQQRIFSSLALIFAEELRSKEGEHLTNQTSEILHKIILDTQFASIIRDVRVFVRESNLYIFEHRDLRKAIEMMPRIQSFGWFLRDKGCSGARMSTQVASCLSALPRSILSLSVPVPGLYMHASNKINLNLLSLKQLTLASEKHELGADLELIARRKIEANHSSLRDLTISGLDMLKLPTEAFNNLTKLAVYHLQHRLEGEDVGLASTEYVLPILRHAVNLETLDLQGELGGSLFPSLAEDPSILPRLKCLRVMAYDTDSQGMDFFSALNKFISPRKALLKSLDLSFGGPEIWDHISLIFPSFSQVELIGLGPKPEFRTLFQIDTLFSFLSPSIRALRLSLAGIQTYRKAMDRLLTCIHGFPRLEFLHISEDYDSIPVIPEDILHCHLPRLETFMINDRIWKIQHLLDGSMSLHPLPRWRYHIRSNSDFLDEDIAWLNTHNVGEWPYDENDNGRHMMIH